MIFQDLISELQIDFNNIIEILMKYYKHFDMDGYIDEEINTKEKEVSNIYAKKDKLLELSLQDSISNIEFCERNNLFNDRLDKISEELNKLKIERKNMDSGNDKVNSLLDLISLKVNSNFTFYKIIDFLLDYIVVSKTGDDKNNMSLNIFLNYNINKGLEKLQESLSGNYEFSRGYDVRGAKRYMVKYMVNCYFK